MRSTWCPRDHIIRLQSGNAGPNWWSSSTTILTAATKVGVCRAINAGPFVTPDLSWDLKKGIAWLRLSAAAPYVCAEAPWDRWRTEPVTCAVIASDDHLARARESGPVIEVRQIKTARDLAELRRIEALDDQPLGTPKSATGTLRACPALHSSHRGLGSSHNGEFVPMRGSPLMSWTPLLMRRS